MGDYKLLELLVCDLAVLIPIYYLYIGCYVGGGGLKLLVHGSVAVAKPFGHLNGLYYPIVVPIICFDYLSKSKEKYLAS